MKILCGACNITLHRDLNLQLKDNFTGVASLIFQNFTLFFTMNKKKYYALCYLGKIFTYREHLENEYINLTLNIKTKYFKHALQR